MRGPRLMSGYLGNKRATADSFVDGWLKTGDVGTFDSNGRIFVVDRQKVRGCSIPRELYQLEADGSIDRISSKVGSSRPSSGFPNGS